MPHAKPFLRTLLRARAEWMESRVIDRAAQNGYGHVTPTMAKFFTHLGGKPIGISEVARRLNVSRQAVHQLANEAAGMGLVEFVPSETDGRVKLIRFTQKGWAMSDTAAQELRRIETELADWLGQEDLEQLRRILSRPWPSDSP